jgi:hypothetical protein
MSGSKYARETCEDADELMQLALKVKQRRALADTLVDPPGDWQPVDHMGLPELQQELALVDALVRAGG